MHKLSVIVPCYNEQECIQDFYTEIQNIKSQMDNITIEYIFVDDGSKDNTLKEIIKLNETDENVNYLSFSRNFGKEAAMLAGLEAATGDFIAVMDVDLQDPPQMLVQMYSQLTAKDNEYDCVATRRVTRKGEPVIRSFFAKMFYKIINKISDTEIVDGARDFRLMTRQMKDAIIQLPEYNRFSKGLFCWVGFNTKWLEYENVERKKGTTKWSFWKLFIYSLDGILAFSTAPLALASLIGISISIFAFLLGIKFFIEKIFVGIQVQGYATLIIVILFLGGLQLFFIGIVGQYIAKAYTEIKCRPKYIVKKSSVNKK